MDKWAENRGFRIEKIVGRPQIVWLKDDGVSAGKDRVSIFIVVPRPKPRGNGGSDETPTALQEPPSKGVIKSPMGAAGPPFTHSLFECQVGDIIILEGGEQLLVRPQREGYTGPRDVCMLLVLRHTSPTEDSTGRHGVQQ